MLLHPDTRRKDVDLLGGAAILYQLGLNELGTDGNRIGSLVHSAIYPFSMTEGIASDVGAMEGYNEPFRYADVFQVCANETILAKVTVEDVERSIHAACQEVEGF